MTTKKSILVIPTGREITLGGKAYILSPLNLNALANLEEEFQGGLEKVFEALNKGQASTVRSLLFCLLRDNYPEITTLRRVGEMVSLKDLPAISEVLGAIIAEG